MNRKLLLSQIVFYKFLQLDYVNKSCRDLSHYVWICILHLSTKVYNLIALWKLKALKNISFQNSEQSHMFSGKITE